MTKYAFCHILCVYMCNSNTYINKYAAIVLYSTLALDPSHS